MAANKVTFARQDELPKLAVPSLEESCEKFLVSLAPLQTPEQHAQTKRVVERFLQNEGPQMQKELLAYAETQLSYIEEFWDDSYLLGNESVVLNLNPFFILEDEPDPARGSQLPRAANLTLASLSFIHDLRHEVLEPDSFRGTPLDMYQYKRLFGLARVPTEHGCKQRLFPDSRHIVVMRKGQLYWFEVLDQEHRSLLTESELVATLRGIVRDADGAGTEYPGQEPIGVLSTEKRRTWYELRAQLEEEPDNRRNLSMVDSALFVLCLDDDAPTDVTDLTNNMLCGSYRLRDGQQVGTCLNRWYDKLQIIVCKNGAAGVNFEHSSADGHTVLRFVGDIYTELILRFARSINPNTKSLFQAKISPFARSEARKHKRASSDVLSDVQARTTPRRLEWTLTPRLVRSVQHAEMRLSDLICQNECFVLEFKGYGKRFITNHGFSPDAFVQMAFQATYYTLYGRAAPTYEPAMTKAFLRGRTETIRTVQPHTMAFVEAWVNHEAPLQDRLQALRNACAGHTRISKEAAAGRGFDRHLYSLLALWRKQHGARGEKMPEFFKDHGYKTLNHVVLSTSNCGNPSLRIFGFGPVVQDGFGIGYIIQDHKLTICASSKHLQTHRFLKALEQYLYAVQRDIIDAFKAANIHTTQTYIDLAGNECDIRTGLPIGSLRIAKDQDPPQKNQCYGTSGYSFYGDDDGHDSEEYIEYNPREGVGKMVFVTEYD